MSHPNGIDGDVRDIIHDACNALALTGRIEGTPEGVVVFREVERIRAALRAESVVEARAREQLTFAINRAGSEPRINPENPCELTWGRWSIEASVEAYPTCEGLSYVVSLSFHGDGDSGEKGLYGKLSTGGVYASLYDAAKEAQRFTPTLTSVHMEESDEDLVEYVRAIDLSKIIDAACAQMRASLLTENLPVIDAEHEVLKAADRWASVPSGSEGDEDAGAELAVAVNEMRVARNGSTS